MSLAIWVLLVWFSSGIIGSWFLWVLYAAVMSWKRVRDAGKLTRVAWVMSAPWFGFGIALDVLLNYLFYSVLCWDLKSGPTVSHRLKKYNQSHDAMPVRKLLVWFFEPLLDPVDPSGNHI